MSFAEAFKENFREIFGNAWPKKPRIRRDGRGWVCFTPDGPTGYGVNPAMAYHSWLFICSRWNSAPASPTPRDVQRRPTT
jgi:hypothetical protein